MSTKIQFIEVPLTKKGAQDKAEQPLLLSQAQKQTQTKGRKSHHIRQDK